VVHKVLTYVEYRAVSDVFQINDPPPPSPPSECVLPRTKGTHSPGGEGDGGGGSIFWKTPAIGLASYNNLSTVWCIWRGLRGGGGGGCLLYIPPSQFRNNLCKDDSTLHSMFVHALQLTQSARLNSYFAVLGLLESPYHRLNMELDLQSLFELHVHCAQLCSFADTPQPPPPPPIWAQGAIDQP
jgi:hypothetical protein